MSEKSGKLRDTYTYIYNAIAKLLVYAIFPVCLASYLSCYPFAGLSIHQILFRLFVSFLTIPNSYMVSYGFERSISAIVRLHTTRGARASNAHVVARSGVILVY